VAGFDDFKVNIARQYLQFAQTEDIYLRSVLEGKRDVLLIEEVNTLPGP
jgi:hypothetical protein